MRGEVDLPPTDPLLGEVSGLLQNAAAYEARASQALGARQWAEAATNLKKAIELSPGNAFSRLNLGTALYMQGDADGALVCRWGHEHLAVSAVPVSPFRLTGRQRLPAHGTALRALTAALDDPPTAA